MSQLLSRVGPLFSSDGTTPAARGGKTGEIVVGQAHGKYYEAASRGNLYQASIGASGQAPGTAIGTTAFFALFNPKGSGKRLVVSRASIGYISGTLGAGTLFWCCINDPTQAAPSGGTAPTPVNCDIGAANNSVAVPRYNATLPISPTILRPMAVSDAELATSVVGLRNVIEDIDGEFVVEPGCVLALEGVMAAGTSPLLTAGLTWEEVQVG
jgi:hypothetical protein